MTGVLGTARRILAVLGLAVGCLGFLLLIAARLAYAAPFDEVFAGRAIAFGDSRDPKGVRLLAVIAVICVFGVTAAIIRAIVSQRTSSAVRTSGQ